MRRQVHVGRRRLHAGRDDADRRLLDPGSVIDRSELAGHVLQADHVVGDAILTGDRALGDRHHPEQLQRQLGRFDGPHRLRHRYGRPRHGDAHLVAAHRLNRPGLGDAAGQRGVDRLAGRGGLRHPVQHQRTGRGAADTAAHAAPRPIRIGHPDDVPDRDAQRVQAHGEGHRLRLQVLAVEDVVAHALGLTAAVAAERGHAGAVDAVAGDATAQLHRLRLLPAEVVGIGPRHLGDGVARLAPGALVGEAALHHVRLVVGERRILGHVRRGDHLACCVEADAAEDGRHVLQHPERVGLGLQVQAAGEPRLHATHAITHQLVAVACDRVQVPLVDVGLRDPVAEAEPVVGHDVVEHPRWIVRPCRLEGAVPHTRIGVGQRAVLGLPWN
ncbi:hypothetical protein G6F22_013208 [Rhizopus arrhizus]|nr:hypothetical protein G6F22_013208 [Rhizopus arrhizus]